MNNSNQNSINEKLRSYEVEVDQDTLWSNLEAHVPKPRKKKRFFIFWLLGAAVVTSVLMLVYFGDTYNVKAGNESDTIVSELKVNNKGNDDMIKGVSEIALTSQSIEEPTPTSGTDLKIITNNSLVTSVSNTGDDTEFDQLPFGTNPFKGVQGFKKSETEVNGGSVMPTTEPIGLRMPELLDIQTVSALKMNVIRQENPYRLAGSITPVNSGRKINPISMEFGMGMGYTYTRIDQQHSVFDFDISEYTAMLPALSADLRIKYDLSQKWSLIAGINYQRLTERIRVNEQLIHKEIKQGVSQIIIDSNGNEIEVSGPVTETTTTQYDAQQHTYFHQMGVPVGLEYKLIENGTWKLHAGMGCTFVWLSRAKGGMLTTEKKIKQFDDKLSPYASSNIIPFGYLGLSYQVNSKLALGLRPEVNYIQCVRDDISFNHTNSTMNITIQYRY